MTTYKITGKAIGYSGEFKGDKNFMQVGRAMLMDNGIQQSVLFGIKTPELMIENLKEVGFSVETVRNEYDEATDEAPHLGRYIREQENSNNAPGDKGMEISKIKIKKGERFVEVLYFKNGNHSQKEVKFNGYEEATDDFLINFRELSKYIIEVLSFPEEWLDRLTTTGISISWQEGSIMGMVITAQMEIIGLNCPLNINTPFVKFYSYAMNNESTEDVNFSKECEGLVEKVMSNAKAYMLGDTKTKQQKLFEG